MKDRIVVVDYKAGNLKSVENALAALGADFIVTGNPGDLRNYDRLVFPGVGEASSAMKTLKSTGLDSAIVEFRRTGKPMIGICLGSQIVLSRSEEGDTECLGLVDGSAVRFSPTLGLKIPHMGWNQVCHRNRHFIFRDIPENSSFYFVHSYYPKPDSTDSVIGETEYGIVFASALTSGNLVATQFHPEKSGKKGLKLLSNFLEWRP
jgi:glutamine amidotransferase